MLTKEFIRRFEESGHRVTRYEGDIEIENLDYVTIAIVSEVIEGLVDTQLYGYAEIPEEERLEIAKVVFEYALTPVRDREAPKYHAKHKRLYRKTDGGYLNLDRLDGELRLDVKKETEEFQTKFTKEELIYLLTDKELERNYELEEVEK